LNAQAPKKSPTDHPFPFGLQCAAEKSARFGHVFLQALQIFSLVAVHIHIA
jgi:hypothetical protein